MSVVVRNLQRSVIVNSFFVKRDFNLLRKIMGLQQLDVALVFLSKNKMTEYNKEYRQKDTSTDILSFPSLVDTISRVAVANPGHGLCYNDMIDTQECDLGDIYLCPETMMVKYNLKEYEIRKATVPLMCHGLLHLCGYLHDTDVQSNIMNEREDAVLKEFSSITGEKFESLGYYDALD